MIETSIAERKLQYKMLMGNEAIAQGLIDEGTEYFAAYPGTPSTEIMEYAHKHKARYGITVHWTTNEAVALQEVAAAAISGKAAAFTAKHVGLNVAADTFMTLAYMGITGSLVMCIADDPSMHSSQNEQDTRWYGKLAHVPVIEPTDPANAYEMARFAMRFSHAIEMPVILRITTRISHGLAPVRISPPGEPLMVPYVKQPERFINIPKNARTNKLRLNAAMQRAKVLADEMEWCYRTWEDNKELGIITTGTAASYCQELREDGTFDLFISYITNPLPRKSLTEFVRRHKKILVVEELDDVLEREVKLIAFDEKIEVEIHGKGVIPWDYELNGLLVSKAIQKVSGTELVELPMVKVDQEDMVIRPPALCAGCPHRSAYYALMKELRRVDAIVANDIGCYSLGVLPPYAQGDSIVCMGGGIGMATGYATANPDKKVVATIGDSTFWHTGLPGLTNAIWHDADVLLMILDNSVTAMTGMQENPSTHSKLSIEDVVKSLGVKVWVTEAFEEKTLQKTIREALEEKGVKVIINRAPCAIHEGHERKAAGLGKKGLATIDHESCTLCRLCTDQLNCPALSIQEGKVQVDTLQCNGCTLCATVCPRNAIEIKEVM